MNIKFLRRKPRFQTLAFTALASLAACSSSPGTEKGGEDMALTDPAGEGATDPSGADLDLGDGASANANPNISGYTTDDSESPGASNADARFGQRQPTRVRRSPFQAGGRWMNAFHVVRNQSDSWESLSQLIYGRPDRADMIAKWNRAGTLKVGRVVYYNSALRPEDQAAMLPIAEDFRIPLEKLEVQAGDSLSAIAARLYGDAQSWKELSALNPEISQPDLIQIGQVLNIQPAQLNTQSVLEQVIAQATAGEPAIAAQPTELAATPDQVAQSADPAAVLAQTEPPVPNGQIEQASPATPAVANVAKPTLVNSASSGMLTKVGAGLVFLCVMVLLIRRWLANKKARDEWANDQLNVTKLS